MVSLLTEGTTRCKTMIHNNTLRDVAMLKMAVVAVVINKCVKKINFFSVHPSAVSGWVPVTRDLCDGESV